jgi:hypothetical protein
MQMSTANGRTIFLIFGVGHLIWHDVFLLSYFGVKIWRLFKTPLQRQERSALFINFCDVKWSFGDFWKLPAQARENIFNFNSIVMQTSTEMGTAHLLHCSPPEVLNFISLFLIRLFDEINCGVVGKKPRS